jgi:hypothetical protein
MNTLLYSIDPGFTVELLKDNGDGTAQARLVKIAEWEDWVEPGTEITIVLSEYADKPL